MSQLSRKINDLVYTCLLRDEEEIINKVACILKEKEAAGLIYNSSLIRVITSTGTILLIDIEYNKGDKISTYKYDIILS